MTLSSKYIFTIFIMIVVIMSVMTYSHISVEKGIYTNELKQRIILLEKNLHSDAKHTILKLKDDVENDLSSFNLSHINQQFEHLITNEDIKGVVVRSNNLDVEYNVGNISLIEHKSIDEMNIQQLDHYFIISVPIVLSSKWGVLSIKYSKKVLEETTLKAQQTIEDEIQKNIKSSLINSLYITIIFLIIGYYLSRKLVNPILLLTEVAQKIGSSDLDKANAQLALIRTNDEVGILSKTFSKMIINLKNSYKQLNNLNESLEIKIDLRTKELDIAKQKAEQANKLKSEFLANMSHEIRTPMNGIIGMTHIMSESELNEKQKSYIYKIDKSAKSLLRIINDILDFSKIEAGKIMMEKVHFRLSDIIKNVYALVEIPADEKEIELVVKIDSKLSDSFDGDSLRISQVLTNLLSNAIKFTNSGRVILYVKKIRKNRIKFTVEDTGIGLTVDEQDRLFKVFSQADGSITREYGGTGLGLSISKQLIELMNGKIWIESQKGVGSKFIFELDLIEINGLDEKDIKDGQYINLDIESHKIKNENIDEHSKKEDIQEDFKNELFQKLMLSLKTNRPKNCEDIISKLDQYRLENGDQKLFISVKNFINSYKFKEAHSLLKKSLPS